MGGSGSGAGAAEPLARLGDRQKRANIEQLRLEYRLLGKVDRNLAEKSSGAIGRAGVAVRSRPPNCKMDACI